jgi:uncharacterized coiled-coil protein SlyX
MTQETSWHLSKSVPITLIVAIVMQTASLVWFISKIDSRIAALENTVALQRERDNNQDAAAREALASLRSDIKEVDRKLDRLIERSK